MARFIDTDDEIQFGPLIDLSEEEMERALASTWRKSTPVRTEQEPATSGSAASDTKAAENLLTAVERLSCQFQSHNGKLEEEIRRLSERMEGFNSRISQVEGNRAVWTEATTASVPGQTDREKKTRVEEPGDELLEALDTIDKLVGERTLQTSRKPRVRPSLYDGKGSWEDYLAQFELVAEINDWNNSEKAIHLAVSVGDKARTTLGDLSTAERKDYKALTSALSSRFGTENRSEMFRATLKTRIRKKDEPLPELAQSIKRLVRLAFPSAPANIRDTMAQDHFIDALRDSMEDPSSQKNSFGSSKRNRRFEEPNQALVPTR